MEKNTGLTNIGNTCYMNAGLQTFVHCGALTKLMLDNEFDNIVLQSYQQFLREYISSPKSVSPSVIKQMVGVNNPLFRSSGQQDTHEFLISLISILEEGFFEMNKNNEMLVNNIPMEKWINKLFDCVIYSIVECSLCDTKSKIKEDHRFLSLPINNCLTLDECLHNYTKHEILNEKWFCNTCKHKVEATKYFVVGYTPKYLYIQFKRFTYDKKNKARKIDDEVLVPIQFKLHKNNYTLRGVIKQSGGINGGHYVSYVKNEDKWFYFNDSHVSEIDENSVLEHAKQAYIFLYVKKIN